MASEAPKRLADNERSSRNESRQKLDGNPRMSNASRIKKRKRNTERLDKEKEINEIQERKSIALKQATSALRNALRLKQLSKKMKIHNEKLSKFLFTKTQPRLYYKPAKMSAMLNMKAKICERYALEECSIQLKTFNEKVKVEMSRIEKKKRVAADADKEYRKKKNIARPS